MVSSNSLNSHCAFRSEDSHAVKVVLFFSLYFHNRCSFYGSIHQNIALLAETMFDSYFDLK